MSSIISPNMSLVIPGVGTEAGPQYALDINASLSLVDQHDHSPGRGVQITPSGMNINAALSLQDNNLTNAQSIVFFPQASAITTLFSLSAAPGGGTGVNDLWYTDGTGIPIQITKNGIVNVVASSIPGESYAAGTFTWVQTQDSLPTTPANFDIGSITIRPNTALTTNGVTIQPPSAIATAYDVVLPLLPASNSFMAINQSGVITTPVTTASLLPTNAGAQSNFYRQSGSGAPVWQTLNSTIATPVTTYTATTVDDIVSCSGSAFTVTLPSAAGIKGKEITLNKTDASLANIITIAGNGAETIGSFGNTVKLATQNESWTLYSDNVNWQVKNHSTFTPTIVDTTVTLSTGSFGTTTTKEWRWHREANYMVGQLIVVQTAGGTAGSGEYHLTVPSSQTIDTAITPASTSSNPSIGLASSSLASTCNVLVNSGSLPQLAGQLCVYDSTHVRMIGQYYNNGTTLIDSSLIWESGTASPNNTTLNLVFSFRIPISGWQP